jgi:hypothetical protein
MIRKGLRPGFRIGMVPRDGQDGYRRVWPFRRSWIAIAILSVMDIIFLIPAITTFRQAISEWSNFDSLFDLVGALFLSAWLLGWSMGPLIMTGILVVMLFGRETLNVRSGTVELFLGLPLVGLVVSYDVSKMRNLRTDHPAKKSGKSWRGTHFVFDYGANSVAFGSDINSDELAEIRSSIHMASGTAIRHGEALPEELQARWEPEEETQPVAPLADPAAAVSPVTLSSASTVVLIIANLFPVAGTIFLDWNLSDVMVLYWAESAVIGIFNLCKIIVIGRWMALLAGPFFFGHFGGFMAIHFLFIYTIFVKGSQGMGASGGDLADVAQLFVNLWPALLVLFASHAYSFFSNFIGRREYRKRTIKDQMSEPYSRIVFMQLVLIFGGGLSLILGQTEPVLIAVIGLKIYFDVKAHIKEHAGEQDPQNGSEKA